MRDSGLASGLLTAFNNETTPTSELKAWMGLSFISTSVIRAAMSWGSSVAGDEVLPEVSSPDADVFRSAKETTSTPTNFQYPKKDEFGGQILIRKSRMMNDSRPGPTGDDSGPGPLFER